MSSAAAYRLKGMTTDASLWPRLAELPLVIESYELEPLHAAPAGGMDRETTQIRLLGLGADGAGHCASSRRSASATRRRSRRCAAGWRTTRACA